jgi:hypothetical protein
MLEDLAKYEKFKNILSFKGTDLKTFVYVHGEDEMSFFHYVYIFIYVA